jgi:hypothetical protein
MNSNSGPLVANHPADLECDGLAIGRIVDIEDGRPIVDYAGNPGGPVEARVAVEAPAGFDHSALSRIPVLLLIDKDQPASPIIVGFVRDRLTSSHGKAMAQAPTDVVLDGRRIVFTAKQEIVLRCGKGSIFLGKDGKIVVKGVNIISRSSGTNKLKGAAVKIN